MVERQGNFDTDGEPVAAFASSTGKTEHDTCSATARKCLGCSDACVMRRRERPDRAGINRMDNPMKTAKNLAVMA